MARGRPATPLGTYGEISVRQLPTGKWQAETRLRLWSGDTVRLQARGTSKTGATNNLKAKCAQRLGAGDADTLTMTSPVSVLLEEWIDGKTKIRPQTRDRYRNAIDNHIVPAFGAMRLNEVSAHYLDKWLQAQPAGVAPNIRTVLKGAFKLATRYGVIPTDPMLSVQPPATTVKEVRALQVSELEPFRRHIAATGNETLTDVIDFCLATGLRAGEVLGVRWVDLDMEHQPPLLWVTGTMAYSREEGHVRQDAGKTDTAGRPIQLPAVAVDIIHRRRAKYSDLPMVFPSGAGSYIWENNFNRWLRDARGDQWEWVTIHSLRKTLGSIVADQLGPHKAADVLGHADSRLTERVYYQRTRSGVPIGNVVDQVLKVSKKSPNNAANEPDLIEQDGENNTPDQGQQD